ncbi:hypothetical protein ACQKK5_07765 [Brevibacillus panacihumi]|uniref:hypothetical protein n=1 Tax=Brevibacillus panacihumi TaxID=497735 RepID=UPI003CFEFA39
MATYAGLVKLGTLRNGAIVKARPTAPWNPTTAPFSGAGLGNIPKFSLDANINNWNIGNTDATEANQLYWHKIIDGSKTLLICDRVILAGVSWNDLNGDNRVLGKTITIDGQQYKLRLLTGGSNYRSGTDGYSGGTPSLNEYDRFVCNEESLAGIPTPTSSDLDKTIDSTDKNSAHNQFWNWMGILSWAQEIYTGNSANRVSRGGDSARFWSVYSAASRLEDFGWRPVLEVLNVPPTLNLTSPPENLLGTDGNCEDLSKWSKNESVISANTTVKKYGNQSFNFNTTSATSWASKNFPVTNGKKYLLMGEVYHVSGVAPIRLYATKTSDYETIGTQAISTPDKTNVWQTIYTKFDASVITDSAVRLIFGETSGSGSVNANVDGIRLYEISQEIFDKINVDPEYTGDKLVAKFPYTDPTINQTLTEGSAYTIAGTASDPDVGDAVTVKYALNGGTARNITSQVSDGATPIPFSKVLTFQNGRLYDGATDVSGPLAENTVYAVSVHATDDKGGTSASYTRSFSVVLNRPPNIVLDPYNANLTGMSELEALTFTGTVTDPEADNVNLTVTFNGSAPQPLKSGVPSGTTFEYAIPVSVLANGTNTVVFTATDTKGAAKTKTLTFTKTGTQTPIKTAIVRYAITPPLGSTSEIVAWVHREAGDLTVASAHSIVASNAAESFANMTKNASVPVGDGTVIEDEFVGTVGTAAPKVTLRLTLTRTDADADKAVKKIMGGIG